MNRWTHQFFDPIFLFLLMLLDSHISGLLSALTGSSWMPVSHLFLIVLMYCISKHSQNFLIIMALILGIIYDSYFIGVLGLASAAVPLIALFCHEIQPIILSSRWTRLVTVVITVFVFEAYIPFMEVIFGIVTVNLVSFVTQQLAPTLLLNILLAFLLQRPLEALYGIKRPKKNNEEAVKSS